MASTAELLKLEIPLILEALGHSLNAPEALTGAETDLNSLRDVLAAFDTAIDAAEANVNLSARGKLDAVATAARKAQVELDAFANKKIAGLAAHLSAVEREITASAPKPRDVGDRLIAELRAQEIRRQFAALDAVERRALYSVANEEVQQALEDAPAVLTRTSPAALPTLTALIDPAERAAQMATRAELRDPQRAAKLRDLVQLKRTYESATATARRAIADVVPAETLPPTIV